MFACHQHHQPPESDISYLLQCIQWSKCFQYSPHFASLHVSQCRYAVMKYQHFHCKVPSAFLFAGKHCWWLEKKKQQLGIQANMKTVSSAPISPFPSKSSDETLSNRKVETPGFAPHPEILSLAAQFFRLLYIISMEVFQPEKMMAASWNQLLGGQSASISFQGDWTKDRTLMNESLCSLSMLWRFRLGCVFFFPCQIYAMQISMAAPKWATAFINHILKGRMCFSYSLPRSINF